MTWLSKSHVKLRAPIFCFAICCGPAAASLAGIFLTDACVTGDLFEFDPASSQWIDLTTVASGSAPSPRRWQGFAEANGTLYVFGGRLSKCLGADFSFFCVAREINFVKFVPVTHSPFHAKLCLFLISPYLKEPKLS